MYFNRLFLIAVRSMVLSVGVGVVSAGVGCGSAQAPTSAFYPTHVSVVSGQVVTQDGTPLDSVSIFVNVPRGVGFDYAITTTLTDRDGNFTYRVQRMSAPPQVSSPDTVRVNVRAYVQKARYLGTDGTAPELQDSVLLTFVPFGQSPPPSRVNFRFPWR